MRHNPVFVLAGNAHQAERWAIEHVEEKCDYRYISSHTALRGIAQGGTMVRVGTWYERDSRDLDMIEACATGAGLTIVHESDFEKPK